jgi:ankyrin repeat protein
MALDRELVGRFIDAAVNDPKEARRLLDQYPVLRQEKWILGETALHFLAIEGFADAVRLLVELGFDVNATNEFGDSPLIDVATCGNHEIAEALLAAGADPNARSNTMGKVIHCAIQSGNARLIELLLATGADPNAQSNVVDNALHFAIRTGNARIVELMLAAGADPTYVTDIEETAYDALPEDPAKRAAIERLLYFDLDDQSGKK